MLAELLKRLLGKRTASPSPLERALALYGEQRYADCVAACETGLRSGVRNVEIVQTLAAAQLAQGRSAEGLATLKQAVSLAPRNAAVHALIGQVSTALGQLDEAVRSYRLALEIDGGVAAPADALVALLLVRGEFDEAEDRARESLRLHGAAPDRLRALAKALFEQGYVDEAIGELQSAVAAGASPEIHSDLLRAMNYSERYGAREIFEAHREWGRRHADPLTAIAAPAPRRDPAAAIRVGYVSPYFRKHAVTFFLESVIANHDDAAIEVVLYSDAVNEDEWSKRLQSRARWRRIVGKSDEEVAQLVREDRIDVLVDLSGHTPGNRLLAFARRAAPVQATWNGYPNTTGMSAMDYRIADARAEPVGESDALHSETLVRLPQVFMSWQPPEDAPLPGRSGAAGPVFGSLNGCYKIGEAAIALWSRVLQRVPGSRLVLFTVPRGRAEARLRDAFERHGIEARRLEFRPRVSHEAFLAAHHDIDVALDAYPFHGTTTTCFSLWMGVPVVSLAGDTSASRIGCSLLPAAGFAELVAATPEDYVSIAARLAQDCDALIEFRERARARMLQAPLTDGAACARALEERFRAMVEASL